MNGYDLKLYAKSSPAEEQLLTKERIGCDGIELQLFSDFFGKDQATDCLYVKNNLDISRLLKHNITAIHAPLSSRFNEDLTLEHLCTYKNHKLLYGLCELADIIGQYYNRQTIIIVHSEIYMEYLDAYGDTYIRMQRYIKDVLAAYPNIKIAIENVTPISKIGDEHIRLCNNFTFDNVALAKRLRFELNTDRIGTVLDTCHAMLSEKYIKVLFREAQEFLPPDLSLKNYFTKNKGVCFLIHLADYQKNGYGKSNHGIPFNGETQRKCYDILDLYTQSHYSCPITLEVAETDYLVCDGYTQTQKLVRGYKPFHYRDA